MTPQKCKLFSDVSLSVLTKYKGKVSNDFIDSINEFIGRDESCTRPSTFRLTAGTKDRDALNEIVVLVTAASMRTTATSSPSLR